MRLALIFTGLAALPALAACGDKSETGGSERRSATGEVLGGEVTDAMLPLDTVRSTSPADASAGAPTGSPPADDARPTAPASPPATRATTLPKPELSGGPGGRQPDVPPLDDR